MRSTLACSLSLSLSLSLSSLAHTQTHLLTHIHAAQNFWSERRYCSVTCTHARKVWSNTHAHTHTLQHAYATSFCLSSLSKQAHTHTQVRNTGALTFIQRSSCNYPNPEARAPGQLNAPTPNPPPDAPTHPVSVSVSVNLSPKPIFSDTDVFRRHQFEDVAEKCSTFQPVAKFI